MVWLLLEALIALGVLLFVVWWTMCSGRPADPLPLPPPAAGDGGPPEGPPGR